MLTNLTIQEARARLWYILYKLHLKIQLSTEENQDLSQVLMALLAWQENKEPDLTFLLGSVIQGKGPKIS